MDCSAVARTATRKALQLLPRAYSPRNFLTQQLRRCEQWLQLDAKLPAVLNGDAKAANATEQLALAYLCQHYKKRYAAPARFFAAAFAADAKLADNLQRQHRYNAACAATWAGCGRGQDAKQLNDQDRARWRQQALAWLRADLARWTKSVDKGTPQGRTRVRQKLQHWQRDLDLAGLRDAAALAKLPATEREACRQLGTDVIALLHRANPK
jgi:hypothetical protein